MKKKSLDCRLALRLRASREGSVEPRGVLVWRWRGEKRTQTTSAASLHDAHAR